MNFTLSRRAWRRLEMPILIDLRITSAREISSNLATSSIFSTISGETRTVRVASFFVKSGIVYANEFALSFGQEKRRAVFRFPLKKSH